MGGEHLLRIGIISDPFSRHGGTWALVRFLYGIIDSLPGCEPLVLTIDEKGHGPARSALDLQGAGLRKFVHPDERSGAPPGMRLCRIPLPGLTYEPLRYRPTPDWRRALDAVDVRIVVGGGILPGFPVAVSGRPFISWVGTPFWEDRLARYLSGKWSRRLYYLLSRRFLTHIEKEVIERSERLLPQSPYTARLLRSRYRVDPGKMRVIPCPIDTELYQPLPGGRDAEGTARLIAVGRFTDPRKNIRLLLETFETVSKTRRDVSLTVIGDAPARLIADCRSWGKVTHLPGLTDHEKARALREADVFVCSSMQEGFGIALMEAMASGIPVVSTRCGGPESFLAESGAGILVPNDSVEGLTNGLMALLGDGERRRRMGQLGRQYSERYCSMREVAGMLLYEIDDVWGTALAAAAPGLWVGRLLRGDRPHQALRPLSTSEQ